jgi:hypothetical protein
MMTNLTPSLKADLSLIFHELAQDSGGLLDIKLSKFSEWSNDRAIDLDSLCDYISDLCASRQIDYGQLRKLADNLIRSDATTSQLLQQADDLAPELLKELVLQASIASTELDKMQDEAGGNKTAHWIANHPIQSSVYGAAGLTLAYLTYRWLRPAQDVENAEQHIGNDLNDANERLLDNVNNEAENLIRENMRQGVKFLGEGNLGLANNYLSMVTKSKLQQGLEVSREDHCLGKVNWTLEEEVYICGAAHGLRFPNDKIRMYKEIGRSLPRSVYPRMYLTELEQWEQAEERKAAKALLKKELDDGGIIDHEKYETLQLENQEILKLEKKSVLNIIPSFDKDKELKAEAEIAKRDQSVIDAFERSQHYSEFLDENQGNFRNFDFDGITQDVADPEIRDYYRLAANMQDFEEKLVEKQGKALQAFVARGEGVIKLEEGIFDRYEASDIGEVKAIRQNRQHILESKSLFSQVNYRHIVTSTIEINGVPRLERASEIFKEDDKIVNRWLTLQKDVFNWRGIYQNKDWTKISVKNKLVAVNDAVDCRLKLDYLNLRKSAFSTLNELSNKAEEDMTDIERALRDNALKDVKRSEMITTYFSNELEPMWEKVEAEAAALLDGVDLLEASKQKLESNFSPSKFVQEFKPEPGPGPGPEKTDLSKIEDSLTHEVDISVRNSASLAEGELLNSADLRRNVERTMFDPAREAEDLYSDLGKVAKSGVRPKSVEVTLNAKLDAELDSGLRRTLSVVPKSGLDGVASEISAKESDLLSNQKAAIDNDLYQVEGSVENNLSEDLSVAKSDIVDTLNQEVQHEVGIIEGSVERETVMAGQVITAEADAAEEAVDTKVANTVDRAE